MTEIVSQEENKKQEDAGFRSRFQTLLRLDRKKKKAPRNTAQYLLGRELCRCPSSDKKISRKKAQSNSQLAISSPLSSSASSSSSSLSSSISSSSSSSSSSSLSSSSSSASSSSSSLLSLSSSNAVKPLELFDQAPSPPVTTTNAITTSNEETASEEVGKPGLKRGLSVIEFIQQKTEREAEPLVPLITIDRKESTLYDWNSVEFDVAGGSGNLYASSLFDKSPRNTTNNNRNVVNDEKQDTEFLTLPSSNSNRSRSDSCVSEDEYGGEAVTDAEVERQDSSSFKSSSTNYLLEDEELVAHSDTNQEGDQILPSYSSFYRSCEKLSEFPKKKTFHLVDGDDEEGGDTYLPLDDVLDGKSKDFSFDSKKDAKSFSRPDFDMEFQVKKLPPKARKDWNKEFRKALEMEDSLERHVELTKITNDFCYAALSFAKIIIAELPLPTEAKTLKPLNLGGVAGGLKYSVDGILFKIAQDTKVSSNPDIWMYGGTEGPNDEAAIRAAHGELNGAECYSSTYVTELNIPLISLITYRGFTIIALSILPVDKSTLLYGSADGGKTVLAADPKLNELMERAGSKLNLLNHQVAHSTTCISGPGDIEGHLGLDGRYYILDFGRVMPPEAPPVDPVERQKDPRSVFYKFLRREFVTYSYYFRKDIQLCSDAFTSWDTVSNPEVAKEHAQQIRNATDYLFEVVVPDQARLLEEQAKDILESHGTLYTNTSFASMRRVLTRFTSSYIFHGVGLNCRHMGRVIEHLQTPQLKRVLLSGIVARSLKRRIEALMRNTMATISYPSACFEEIIVNYLNSTILARDNQVFWQENLPDLIEKLFPKALEGDRDNLRNRIDIPLTLVSLSIRLNLTFTKRFKLDVVSLPQLSLDVRDIKHFEAKIRNHYLIELSFADRDLKIADLATEGSTVARLMAYARKSFLKLKKKLPYCPVLSEKLAFVYAREGLFQYEQRKYEKSRNLLRKACVHYEVAIKAPIYQASRYQGVFQRYYVCLYYLSQVLAELDEKEDAEEIKNLSLEIHAMFAPDFKEYSQAEMLKMSAASLLPKLTEIFSWFQLLPQRKNMNCRDGAEQAPQEILNWESKQEQSTN